MPNCDSQPLQVVFVVALHRQSGVQDLGLQAGRRRKQSGGKEAQLLNLDGAENAAENSVAENSSAGEAAAAADPDAIMPQAMEDESACFQEQQGDDAEPDHSSVKRSRCS